MRGHHTITQRERAEVEALGLFFLVVTGPGARPEACLWTRRVAGTCRCPGEASLVSLV